MDSTQIMQHVMKSFEYIYLFQNNRKLFDETVLRASKPNKAKKDISSSSKIIKKTTIISIHISNRASHAQPEDINIDYQIYKKNKARNNFLSINHQHAVSKESRTLA